MSTNRKLISVFLKIFIFLIFFAPTSKAENENLFPDLPKNHPDLTAIQTLVDLKIISGFADGNFYPEQEITRAEAIKIVLAALQSQTPENIFAPSTKGTDTQVIPSDIKPEEWWYPYIKTALDRQIISGYPDGTVQPQTKLNLAAAAKIILTTFNTPISEKVHANPYYDVPYHVWHAKYFQFFQEYYLLDPDQNGNIFPDKNLTRSEFTRYIYRYLKKDDFRSARKGIMSRFFYGKATFYGEGDGFDGRGTANGETFDKNKFTAASRTLPFNTRIKVTSIENGKSVEVRINDRGPYHYAFIADLSAAAFEQMAPISRGYIAIKFEILE